MKKYNYTVAEQAHLFQIFKKNDVEIQTEDPNNIIKSFEELYSVTLNSYKRNFRKYSYDSLFYQHNVTDKKIVGYSKQFKYYNLMMFDTEIIKHVETILNTLSPKGSTYVDMTSWFSQIFDTNNKPTGYQFSTVCPFHDIEADEVEYIFKQLKYNETMFHWRVRNNAEHCVMSRLIYSNLFTLKQIGYFLSPSIFLESFVMQKYEKYVNFYDFIGDKINTFKFIDVIFDLNNEDYISLEFAPDDIACLEDLYNLNIITGEERQYIENNKKTKECPNQFILKLTWNDSKKCHVTWYNKEKENDI